MNRITSLFVLLLIASSATGKSPQNVVLILADDLGWADTTLYGKTSFYETPNIQRLAARGMTFSNAYASPICSPTRASIMTGQNPARHGMTAPAAHLPTTRFEATVSASGPAHQKCTNVRSSTRLATELPFLSELVKDAGYSTAHFGKWHLGRQPHSPLERGFDLDLPHWWGPGPKSSYLAPWGYEHPDFKEGQPGEHIEDRMAAEAVAWLKNRDSNHPFFMNYWQFSVHAPFGAKPELIECYRQKLGNSVVGLEKPETREKRLQSHPPSVGLPQQSPTYAAMVHSLDDALGSLLDAIDAEGIADETIIIFYSDNGGNIHCGLEETAASGNRYITPITSNAPLRGGKGGIHEGGIRVPAVVVWPGMTQPGSRSEVRIQSNDLYPTILKMLQVEQPKEHAIDGVDFTQALRGQAMERGPMFTYVPGHGATPHWLPPSMAVHHGDWKLIRTFHYGEDGEHEYRLYNLQEDLGESDNLAGVHPQKVRELDQLIEQYIAAADVVVPQPNPNFDPAAFDPATIGVQPGGLKMPPAFKSSQVKTADPKPANAASQKSLLGWIAKNTPSRVQGETLQLSPAGRRAFIANAKIRVPGPVDVKLRMKTRKAGVCRLQWRTEDQDTFPETGQEQSFDVAGGDWQELSVPLKIQGRLVHLRLVLSDSKQPTEIDWIEVNSTGDQPQQSQRWDFKETKDPKEPVKVSDKVKHQPAAVSTDRPQPFSFHESFDDFDASQFLTTIPNKNTEVKKGVLWTRGASGGKYPPMVYLEVDGKDLEISFRYRHLQAGGMVWFFVDGDDGFGSIDHMLRVKFNRSGIQLQIDAHSLDPNHPDRQNNARPADPVSGAYRLNKRFPKEDVNLTTNVWRDVSLSFQGNQVTIAVDQDVWHKTLEHACFNQTKRKLLWMQNGGEQGIEIDDIKIKESPEAR